MKNLLKIIFVLTFYYKINAQYDCSSIKKGIFPRMKGLPFTIRRCKMLLIVDDSVMEKIDHKEWILRKKLENYLKQLNSIFHGLSVTDSPVVIDIHHVIYLKNFLPGCTNGYVRYIIMVLQVNL